MKYERLTRDVQEYDEAQCHITKRVVGVSVKRKNTPEYSVIGVALENLTINQEFDTYIYASTDLNSYEQHKNVYFMNLLFKGQLNIFHHFSNSHISTMLLPLAIILVSKESLFSLLLYGTKIMYILSKNFKI